MNVQDAWNRFAKSGKMSDYMIYKASLGGQLSPPPQAASSVNVTPENDRPLNLTEDKKYMG